ncbi:hypothetical protein SRHO_G00236640 [Serrasalmus rhombeus]
MLRAGIIELSESPWASGVVMVNKKKSQKMRFCVDYRPLNSVTKKGSYPLPRIDESLDLVSGSSWFSSLDLRSGYWQVPLSPDAKPKTAFCTGRGLWHFRVLGFGLCNAPATFELLMEKVLDEIPRQECLVYLDDILVHGSSFKAALMSLRRTLQKIADKCCFMRRELEFLGHRIGGEGISTMEEKVQVVQDWPTPSNLRELKSFIGLASYYRPELAIRSGHNLGMGAVLSQVGQEGEKVVAYFSRTFNKAEWKREARENELRFEEERDLTRDRDVLLCRVTQVVDPPEWREHQELVRLATSAVEGGVRTNTTVE